MGFARSVHSTLSSAHLISSHLMRGRNVTRAPRRMNITDARATLAIERVQRCRFGNVAGAVFGDVGWWSGTRLGCVGLGYKGTYYGGGRGEGKGEMRWDCGCEGGGLVVCGLPVEEVGVGADAASPEAVGGGWGREDFLFFWVGMVCVGLGWMVTGVGFFVAGEVDADGDNGLEAVRACHGEHVGWCSAYSAWWIEE